MKGRLPNENMKKFTLILIITVIGIGLWLFVGYTIENINVVPQIRIQKISFPDYPRLNKQILDMTAEMDDETKENRTYFINIFKFPDSLQQTDSGKLKVIINHYKHNYFRQMEFNGYFVEGESIFIVGQSDIRLQLVTPGKSWRTFKSQTAYPFFGKNVQWSYCFCVDSCGFKQIKEPRRLEYDAEIAEKYRDSINDAYYEKLDYEIEYRKKMYLDDFINADLQNSMP